MSPRFYIAAAALLTCAGLARVAATYSTFRATYDEPWHISIGMESLQWGTSTYDAQHLPLARAAVALGPYLAGLRSERHLDMAGAGSDVVFGDGNAILESNAEHLRNLAVARVGTLPFLAIACAVIFLWASRWFSAASGLCAVLLLISTPPILGHAGVATVDMACAATTFAALFQFLRWMEAPGWRRATWLGVAVALAFLTKLSSVAFLGACFTVAMLIQVRRIQWRATIRDAAVAVLVMLCVMWAGYGFTLEPLDKTWGPHPRLDATLQNSPALAGIWSTVAAVPLPLTEFVAGIRDLSHHNAQGHDSYLLGEYRNSGWWYFFPVVLAVKTPIGLLVLACGGLLWIFGRWREVPWQQLLTAVFPLAILAVCMGSRLDLGVRHILPIYPLLAIIGGHAIAETVRARGLRSIALVPVALAVWVIVDSVRAHPDYLAYFNQFAPHPEQILAESDLDWGQDLERLTLRLQQRNVKALTIAYFGSALMEKTSLPTYEYLEPFKPARGYIAISVHHLYLSHAKDGSYDWLKKYTPQERVGKSIDLFYIE